jgi:chaperone required for assembly of F1-ATPase
MTGWAAKRFWKDVEVLETDEGYAIALDGRPIRTPGKAQLAIPSRPLALAIADEWRGQNDVIDPATMPMTRYANTAIDRVRMDLPSVAGIVSAFAETDLLCYRAESPAALVARQSESWDPLLEWVERRFGTRLVQTRGVIPVPQSEEALAHLRSIVASLSPHELTALHEIVSLTGSLVLGLAVLDGERLPDEVWAASRIDEEWQVEQWGRDEEAERIVARRHAALLEACAFLDLVRSVD